MGSTSTFMISNLPIATWKCEPAVDPLSICNRPFTIGRIHKAPRKSVGVEQDPEHLLVVCYYHIVIEYSFAPPVGMKLAYLMDAVGAAFCCLEAVGCNRIPKVLVWDAAENA